MSPNPKGDLAGASKQLGGGADDATRAYAEGRGDQYEDDCAIVRALFDELNDVDVLRDGFINTTRVRGMLAHFDMPKPAECSYPDCTRPECDALGCMADRVNDERESMRAAAAVSPEERDQMKKDRP